MFTKKSVLVIPTKDRNNQLKKTLNQFLSLKKFLLKKLLLLTVLITEILKKIKIFLKNKKNSTCIFSTINFKTKKHRFSKGFEN